jgi:uncharacterized 2Fe-2S/4Fe-4S cluster protein (DUF4445 family)
MTSRHVDFEPVGRRGQCQAEQSLLECARELGVDLASICGGKGSCGRCKVQIVAGQISEPTGDEKQALTPLELEQGYRLACQVYLASDVKVHIPPESLTAPQRTQVEGMAVSVQPDPPVKTFTLRLHPASLLDPRADDERLLAALTQEHPIEGGSVDLEALRCLSPQLRAEDWQVRVGLRGREIVAVGPASVRWLGLAVDVGTTKIAAYLVDLESGQTLAAQGSMNPQIAYGEDVITRLAAASQAPSDAARLQQSVVEALNQLATKLCAEVGAELSAIVEAVVVGNTAMHHLLLRLPVQQLAQAPYVPAVRAALDVKARDLGLRIAPGAYVHLLPNIAGFVGADHVAMLLATQSWLSEGVALALDIGTNTEICLASHGDMKSLSCASGPAFEGAHIKYGMRAAPGAIEHVRLVGDRVEYKTIGDVSPVGLCGSGLLDAVAQLLLAGVLDRSGQMQAHPRVRAQDGMREFVLVGEEERGGLPAITLTQRDVRELQLAKAAIRTGFQSLLEASGRTQDDIERVIIAGAFGTYVDVASAITIGLLPALPLDRFEQVGNAAGTGARLALISHQKRREAQRIARRVEYLELATTPGFSHRFAQAVYLPG